MELCNGNDKQLDVIENIIANLFDDELVTLNNEYCNKFGYEDNLIYEMSEIDDVLCNFTPTQILDICSDGFSINDKYFTFSTYGVESNNNIHNLLCEDYDHFATFILDYGDVSNIMSDNVDEIRDVFIEYTHQVIQSNHLPYNSYQINDIVNYISDNYDTELYSTKWEDLILTLFDEFDEYHYSEIE